MIQWQLIWSCSSVAESRLIAQCLLWLGLYVKFMQQQNSVGKKWLNPQFVGMQGEYTGKVTREWSVKLPLKI